MIEALKQTIRILLTQDHQRLTPISLERFLRRRHPSAHRAMIKVVTREMVAEGELRFVNTFSTTFLEWNHVSYQTPLGRVMIHTDSWGHRSGADETAIRLSVGGAFGSGDHPTTRLCLAALEKAQGTLQAMGFKKPVTGLDVGTGTGVLAMAAVRLGVDRVAAVDIDALACHEAMANVRTNLMTQQIMVVAGSLETIRENYCHLMSANLRPPTLTALLPRFLTVCRKPSVWVLSGFRPGEAENFYRGLPSNFDTVWKKEELNWEVLVLVRR